MVVRARALCDAAASQRAVDVDKLRAALPDLTTLTPAALDALGSGADAPYTLVRLPENERHCYGGAQVILQTGGGPHAPSHRLVGLRRFHFVPPAAPLRGAGSSSAAAADEALPRRSVRAASTAAAAAAVAVGATASAAADPAQAAAAAGDARPPDDAAAAAGGGSSVGEGGAESPPPPALSMALDEIGAADVDGAEAAAAATAAHPSASLLFSMLSEELAAGAGGDVLRSSERDEAGGSADVAAPLLSLVPPPPSAPLPLKPPPAQSAGMTLDDPLPALPPGAAGSIDDDATLAPTPLLFWYDVVALHVGGAVLGPSAIKTLVEESLELASRLHASAEYSAALRAAPSASSGDGGAAASQREANDAIGAALCQQRPAPALASTVHLMHFLAVLDEPGRWCPGAREYAANAPQPLAASAAGLAAAQRFFGERESPPPIFAPGPLLGVCAWQVAGQRCQSKTCSCTFCPSRESAAASSGGGDGGGGGGPASKASARAAAAAPAPHSNGGSAFGTPLCATCCPEAGRHVWHSKSVAPAAGERACNIPAVARAWGCDGLKQPRAVRCAVCSRLHKMLLAVDAPARTGPPASPAHASPPASATLDTLESFNADVAKEALEQTALDRMAADYDASIRNGAGRFNATQSRDALLATAKYVAALRVRDAAQAALKERYRALLVLKGETNDEIAVPEAQAALFLRIINHPQFAKYLASDASSLSRAGREALLMQLRGAVSGLSTHAERSARRFSASLLVEAMRAYKASPTAYDIIRDGDGLNIAAPSAARLLQTYTMLNSEGLSETALNLIHLQNIAKDQGAAVTHAYTLTIDGLHVRAGLLMDPKDGSIRGYAYSQNHELFGLQSEAAEAARASAGESDEQFMSAAGSAPSSSAAPAAAATPASASKTNKTLTSRLTTEVLIALLNDPLTGQSIPIACYPLAKTATADLYYYILLELVGGITKRGFVLLGITSDALAAQKLALKRLTTDFPARLRPAVEAFKTAASAASSGGGASADAGGSASDSAAGASATAAPAAPPRSFYTGKESSYMGERWKLVLAADVSAAKRARSESATGSDPSDSESGGGASASSGAEASRKASEARLKSATAAAAALGINDLTGCRAAFCTVAERSAFGSRASAATGELAAAIGAMDDAMLKEVHSFANPFNPMLPDIVITIDPEHHLKRGVNLIRSDYIVFMAGGRIGMRVLAEVAKREGAGLSASRLDDKLLFASNAERMSVPLAQRAASARVLFALVGLTFAEDEAARASGNREKHVVLQSIVPPGAGSAAAASAEAERRQPSSAPPPAAAAAAAAPVVDKDEWATFMWLRAVRLQIDASGAPGASAAGAPNVLLYRAWHQLERLRAWQARAKNERFTQPPLKRRSKKVAAAAAEAAASSLPPKAFALPTDSTTAHICGWVDDACANLAGVNEVLMTAQHLGLSHFYMKTLSTTENEHLYADLRGGTGSALGASNSTALAVPSATLRLAIATLVRLNNSRYNLTRDRRFHVIVLTHRGVAGERELRVDWVRAKSALVAEPAARAPAVVTAVVGEPLAAAAAAGTEPPLPLRLPCRDAFGDIFPLGSFSWWNDVALHGDPTLRVKGSAADLFSTYAIKAIFPDKTAAATVLARLSLGTAEARGVSWQSLIEGGPRVVHGNELSAGERRAVSIAPTVFARSAFSYLQLQPSRLLLEMVCVMHAEVEHLRLAGAHAVYDPALVKFSRIWLDLQPALALLILPLCRVAVDGAADVANVDLAAMQLASLAGRWFQRLTFGEYKRVVVAPHLRTWKSRMSVLGVSLRSYVAAASGVGAAAARPPAGAAAATAATAADVSDGENDSNDEND